MLKPSADTLPHSRENPILHGFAMAASAIPGSLLLGYLGEAYVHGFDGLIIGLALLGGLVLSAIAIVPGVRAAGAESLPEYFQKRFGGTAGTIACAVMAVAALLLLSAELLVASRVIESLSGVGQGAIVVAIGASAAALTAVARTRAGPFALAALAVLLVISTCAAVFIAAGAHVLPFLQYGSAVNEIATHEAAMMDAGLADFRSLKAHGRAFLELDALNTLAIGLTLLAGAVILIPASKARHLSERGSRLATVVSAAAALAVLISIPALATYTKREVYASIARGTPLTALPVWLKAPSEQDLVRIHGLSARMLDDVTRVVANNPTFDPGKVQSALSQDPAWTASARAFAEAKPPVRMALVEAAKTMATASGVSAWDALQASVLPQAAMAQNNKSGLLTHGALDISPLAVPLLAAGLSPNGTLTAGCLILASLIAAAATIRRVARSAAHALAHASPSVDTVSTFVLIALPVTASLLLPDADGSWLAVTAFSMAAAGLFPALLAGAWSRRISRTAAVAAMAVGSLAAISYSVATHVFPARTYEVSEPLSNASDGTKKKFESLRSAWQKAPDGAQKEQAKAALETYAAGTAARPNIALWWGVASASSAIFALPLAFLTLLLVELPRRMLKR